MRSMFIGGTASCWANLSLLSTAHGQQQQAEFGTSPFIRADNRIRLAAGLGLGTVATAQSVHLPAKTDRHWSSFSAGDGQLHWARRSELPRACCPAST